MGMNAFYCSRCGKHTKQVEISMREIAAINKDGALGEIIGGFNDITGLGKLTGTILGRKFYKCCECGKATTRNSAGESVCEWN